MYIFGVYLVVTINRLISITAPCTLHTVILHVYTDMESHDQPIVTTRWARSACHMHCIHLVYNCMQQNQFSKCDTCVRFSQERLKIVGQKEATLTLQKEFRAHLDMVE